MPPEELFNRLSEAGWFVTECECWTNFRGENPFPWHIKACHYDGRRIIYAIVERPTLQEALEALAEKCGVDARRPAVNEGEELRHGSIDSR